MDLFEIDETQHLRREEAAARLHALADALARNNAVEFERTAAASPCTCPTRSTSRSRSRSETTTSWRSSSPGESGTTVGSHGSTRAYGQVTRPDTPSRVHKTHIGRRAGGAW